MKTLISLCVAFAVAGSSSFAQVKSTYQYNTSMPYGVLDLRTRITSSDYYYLQENKTFSFRESSPGVRTNTYLDMTGWESNAYKQGNLRHRNGTRDDFVMNYRLLFPVGYQSTYAKGYPMIVHLHGAVERANCYYNNCYHATYDYTVQANSPPAPKTATHRLLNNDHSLNVGGRQYLAARDLAGSRLPNDPAMPARAFPGFVLVPQMFNIWDSVQVEDVVRIVRLLASKYRIDQDRIYIQGLSIGGHGVYEAIKRASWLFAAALPMSSVTDGNIFEHKQQGRVAHVPIWIFQGGLDKNPTPAFTQSIVANFRKAGAVVRYTYFADLGHTVWTRAYGLSDYFSWMLKQSKANLHAYAGNLTIDRAKGQYPTLMLAEGFLAYQWEKNGVIVSTAKSPTYRVTAPGTYRARFSRKSTTPTTEAQWNRWSDPIKVIEVSTSTMIASSARTAAAPDTLAVTAPTTAGAEEISLEVYPNPASAENLNLRVYGLAEAPVEVRLVNHLGQELYAGLFETPAHAGERQLQIPATAAGGVYVLVVNQGQRQVRKKVVFTD